VVLGQGGPMSIQAALSAGKILVDAAGPAVKTVTVLEAGRPVATVRVPWGGRLEAVTADAAVLPAWGGLPVTLRFQPTKIGPSLPAGGQVGTLTVAVAGQQVQLAVRTSGSIPPPSLGWRLRRMP
jgi:D-alanyl-D-alanine carboxypeptidase (penicillin-binding protein 5/6)